VSARVKASDSDDDANATAMNAAIYTDGLAELLGTASKTTTITAAYGSYTLLSTPSGGWTWQKISDLEVKAYRAGSGIKQLSLFIVELAIHDPGVVIVSGSSDKTVNVSDSVTVTESVTMLIPELFVNKTDTATVTELVVREVESYVNKSDTTTVTEAVFRAVESFINKSDTATVTENLAFLTEQNINKSESVTVTENRVLLIPELYLNVSENLNVVDAVTPSQIEYFIRPTENVTVTEATSLLIPDLYVNKSGCGRLI